MAAAFDWSAFDLECIEADFRAGILSLREIGTKHGLSHVNISRKANKEGWTRDLLAKSNARADEIVTATMANAGTVTTPRRAVTKKTVTTAVTSSVTDESVLNQAPAAAQSVRVVTQNPKKQNLTNPTLTENEIIEAGAQAIANVKLSHRTNINRYRLLLDNLMGELEHQTDNRELYCQLGNMMYEPNVYGRDPLNDLYHRVIALPQRSKIIVDLVNTLKVLITLEREAFNIDNSRQDEDIAPATPVQIVIQVEDASLVD
ncbi:hypothetical protein [Deefgea sp. CFH1-16]|uniref:hypothetical protein n=1 Tax=Deefgea sp. CFH1-16 TaxID=2675457 RepID=UPI0015F6340D|nr:hypothetical protein [Deefgea sp. CFH1-16]MBM5575819.1 hypothetical protein [Deefgea sp. CFH1-16]